MHACVPRVFVSNWASTRVILEFNPSKIKDGVSVRISPPTTPYDPPLGEIFLCCSAGFLKFVMAFRRAVRRGPAGRKRHLGKESEGRSVGGKREQSPRAAGALALPIGAPAAAAPRDPILVLGFLPYSCFLPSSLYAEFFLVERSLNPPDFKELPVFHS